MAVMIAGRRLSLAWLKPPVVPHDGRMSLYDHLRDLRYRLIASVVGIGLGMGACAFWFTQLYGLLLWPLRTAEANLAQSHPDLVLQATNEGVTTPFLIFMKVIGISGLLVTAPWWLHQLWAFIVPGLLAQERKWARIFVVTATPLFLAGTVTGFLMMPAAIKVLIGFTPEGFEVVNLLTIDGFLSFLIRVMLVFGVSYLVPLVMLLLNLLGVLSSQHMKKARPFIILAAFIFSAVATPTTDPFSMLALALPLTVLLMVTEQIARAVERRRARADEAAAPG